MLQTSGLPDQIAAVLITDQLVGRPAQPRDYLEEKLALQELANEMADRPSSVLPRLVELAMRICGAQSAGVSVLDSEARQFRWLGLKGELSVFEGATTPRDFSPCGVCLDHRGAILMEHPERAYDWIKDANISAPEVLLVPLAVRDGEQLGTLWTVAHSRPHFDIGHVRSLEELAAFTGVALRMIQTEEKLKRALEHQETLTQEMSHRVKNVFAIADGLIRATARNSETKEQFASSLSGRLHALADAHALTRRSLADASRSDRVALSEIIERILAPYGSSPLIEGPAIELGEHAAVNFALVFHELATNAGKYGALTSQSGHVAVRWAWSGDDLDVRWAETGGPPPTQPDKQGFGSALMKSAVASLDGGIELDWRPEGLAALIRARSSALGR